MTTWLCLGFPGVWEILLACVNRLQQNTFIKPHVNGSVSDISTYVIIIDEK